MTSTQSKRQKLANLSSEPAADEPLKEGGASNTSKLSAQQQVGEINNSFGVDVDDLTDDTTDSDDEDDYDLDEENGDNTAEQNGSAGDRLLRAAINSSSNHNHLDIQEQLAAAGPAGVAAAAAIATARKRKRPHSFETNPSVRKRQQTRLIRKLRACIDEYTMRVGQQAVVLITMPGKAVHNFKVFGAQPLESVIRACKQEIMGELEQALLEQAPQQFKEDANKHELPPLVIDGIPTPVEKMTQAQLRAFIPLMLKYSTGRGKPGWGKDSTRPPWWPETLPWANVRSDARDESEKQRISWTTTLRQIVTNCYQYHGRDDLLPAFDESEEAVKQEQEAAAAAAASIGQANTNNASRRATDHHQQVANARSGSRSASRIHQQQQLQHQLQQQQQQQQSANDLLGGATIYSTQQAYSAHNHFVHTISNSDGTVSLIQVDPANAQILTLPDGTQVRAVRLQTLGSDALSCSSGQQQQHQHQQPLVQELQAIQQQDIDNQMNDASNQVERSAQMVLDADGQTTTLSISEASLNADGQIIVTGEDGTQSCYPMSSLVSIPASVYQQFTQAGQQLSIVSADGTSIPANALTIHTIQDPQQQHDSQQQQVLDQVANQVSAEEKVVQVGEQSEVAPEPAADKSISNQDNGQRENSAGSDSDRLLVTEPATESS